MISEDASSLYPLDELSIDEFEEEITVMKTILDNVVDATVSPKYKEAWVNQTKVKDVILDRLYDSYFQSGDFVKLNTIREELDMDNTAFWNIVDAMEHEGLIKVRTVGGNYEITSKGINTAEEQGIVTTEFREQNQSIRTRILDKHATVYEERGSYADVSLELIANELNIDMNKILRNLLLLNDEGYTEPFAVATTRITQKGLKAVQAHRQRVGLIEEYIRISESNPQERGRALQKLIARIVEEDGWSQEEGVRTAHEEIDVMLHKEQNYFLLEAKWKKRRVEANVVRELFGKLGNRDSVKGLLVSMSGFTKGAVNQAKDYSGQRAILFFGKQDIESLIFGRTTFDKLLSQKNNQLITRLKINYDDI